MSSREREQIKNGIKRRDNDPYVQFFKHFQRYSHFYKPIFKYKGGKYFYIQFIEVFKKHFHEEAKHLNVNDEELKMNKELIIYSIAHVHFGVINYWLDNDMSDSPETMGEQLNSLLSSISSNF
nr:TetR-like C-terminal domain-containing protein [Thalassobacillus sp. CUG 92003]